MSSIQGPYSSFYVIMTKHAEPPKVEPRESSESRSASSRHAGARRAMAALALMGTAAWPLAARAEPSPALDRVSVWLGGYRTAFDGTVELRNPDGSLDTGVLPLFSGHESVQRARLDWLLFDRQGFTVDYYKLDRSQSRQAGQLVTINGTHYDANAEINSRSRTDFGNVSYRWWFGSGDAVFGAGLGAGYYRLLLQIDAQASVTGVQAAATSKKYDDNAWAPMGALGLRWRLADGLRFYADVTGVDFRNDRSRITLTNGALGLEWFPWQNLGLSAEYATSKIHYRRSDTDGDQGFINFDLKGPALYLRWRY